MSHLTGVLSIGAPYTLGMVEMQIGWPWEQWAQPPLVPIPPFKDTPVQCHGTTVHRESQPAVVRDRGTGAWTAHCPPCYTVQFLSGLDCSTCLSLTSHSNHSSITSPTKEESQFETHVENLHPVNVGYLPQHRSIKYHEDSASRVVGGAPILSEVSISSRYFCIVPQNVLSFKYPLITHEYIKISLETIWSKMLG